MTARHAALAVALAASLVAADAFAHGTVIDSRMYRVRVAGEQGNLPAAFNGSYYTWNQNSHNFTDYASPTFSYESYVPNGTIGRAGINDGIQTGLDFRGLDTPSANWPTLPTTAGAAHPLHWVATAPHDPSFFDVFMTKPGFDVATDVMGWDDLDKLGRWSSNSTQYPVTNATGASPVGGQILSYDWNVPIPANRSGKHALVVVWQREDPAGEAFFATQDIFVNAAVPTTPTWAATGGGAWATAANWTNGVPNAAGASATFGPAIGGPATVTTGTLATSFTVGSITFDSPHAYTIAGPGTVMLDAHDHAGGNHNAQGQLSVTRGGHAFNAGLMLHGSATATVAAGASLTLGGPLMFSSNGVLTKAGAGTLRIDSASVTGASNAMLVTTAGTLRIERPLSPSVGVFTTGGAQTTFAATTSVASLTMSAAGTRTTLDAAPAAPIVVKATGIGIGSGAVLDLGDNALIVDYAVGQSMFGALDAAAASGANGQATAGRLLSSATAGDARLAVGVVEASAIGSPATFLGTSLDATSAIARLTLKGDTNLDASVNFTDLVALAQRYGSAGTWANGDSDYSGTVNFGDLVSLAQNYSQSLSIDAGRLGATGGEGFASDLALAQSLVPEPATIGALGLASVTLRRRRPA